MTEMWMTKQFVIFDHLLISSAETNHWLLKVIICFNARTILSAVCIVPSYLYPVNIDLLANRVLFVSTVNKLCYVKLIASLILARCCIMIVPVVMCLKMNNCELFVNLYFGIGFK